jgi:hypothetical protein
MAAQLNYSCDNPVNENRTTLKTSDEYRSVALITCVPAEGRNTHYDDEEFKLDL